MQSLTLKMYYGVKRHFRILTTRTEDIICCPVVLLISRRALVVACLHLEENEKMVCGGKYSILTTLFFFFFPKSCLIKITQNSDLLCSVAYIMNSRLINVLMTLRGRERGRRVETSCYWLVFSLIMFCVCMHMLRA